MHQEVVGAVRGDAGQLGAVGPTEAAGGEPRLLGVAAKRRADVVARAAVSQPLGAIARGHWRQPTGETGRDNMFVNDMT